MGVWRRLFCMSKITIRNLGLDVIDRLRAHAKADDRALEAEIRHMLTMLVGLGPSDQDLATMHARAKAMQLEDEQVMFGVMSRMHSTRDRKERMELKPMVHRTPAPQKSESNPL